MEIMIIVEMVLKAFAIIMSIGALYYFINHHEDLH
jgi:hypothetical protein